MEPDQLASNQRRKRRSLSDSISTLGRYTIAWAAPTEQVKHLVSRGDEHRWVGFRDGFMSKWTNLNIVCGLIMGAMSTVLFADVELDPVAFGFGVVSLLSSLISIGFGTGLMYVLGDVSGGTLQKIGTRYPILFIFALSIPQVWAGTCIVSFFLCTGIFAWNASDKGWTPKAGIIGSAVLTIAHLIAFAHLFHKQHNVENMIDDETDGGMEHNIHLAQEARQGQLSDKAYPPRPRPEPMQPAPFGGSGLGHFRPSTSPEQSLGIGKPLADSPDPMSSESVFNQASRARANGERQYVNSSLNSDGRTNSLEGSSVNLFSASQPPKRIPRV